LSNFYHFISLAFATFVEIVVSAIKKRQFWAWVAGLIIFGLYFAFVGAYLSIVLARVLRQNGRVLDRMDEGFKLIAKLITEENEKTRKEILTALGKS